MTSPTHLFLAAFDLDVTLRDAPPLELVLNDPTCTAPADLLTELWIPLA